MPDSSLLESATLLDRGPVISPDYAGVTVPANFAPINFRVLEPGDAYLVRIAGDSGSPILVSSPSPRIEIPIRRWRGLLEGNRGKDLRVAIAVRTGGDWQRFAPLKVSVADSEIDRYLVHRQITPIYNLWRDVGLYQRDLTGWRQRTVLHGSHFSWGCTNCHSFSANRTDRMTVGVRSSAHGSSTLMVDKGRIEPLGTGWTYTSWHPGGNVAAYSSNKVRQFFHTARQEVRDVVDLDSDLMIFDARTHKVEAPPQLAEQDRLETYPAWSADGKTLYFCSAPILWKDRDAMPPERYEEVRYELRSASYDPDTGKWGPAQTVISANDAGKSILLPRPSPDGRWLIYCQTDYGCFPVLQPSSDLWLLDLRNGKRRALKELNSEWSESWHSWSHDGRWVAFSSKRLDGLFTRTFFSYVDEAGSFSKPVILPQRDPDFYDGYLRTFSVPELVTEPVPVSQRALARAARSTRKTKLELPEVSMTAKKGEATSPWRQGGAR